MPPSAAVLNFVIQYYDHYDNNGGSDHKLAVNLPAGATSVDAWADGLLSSITTAVTTARKNEEAAVEAMERMKTEAREAVRVSDLLYMFVNASDANTICRLYFLNAVLI